MGLARDKEAVIRTAKYLFAGGSSALIELLIFQSLCSLLHDSVVVANLIAIACSTVYNFAFNRNVTFKSSSNVVRSGVLYCLLLLFNSAFSTCFIAVASGMGLLPIVAKIISMCCTVCWNYVIYRKVIFI